ncbi:hemagglutinin repeat-containing protein [Aliarcobacter butzleri]|uniref:two-partner secretion domain-containing protein n=2 Tax=Aliarcobacter butzleri TaxID=28197 RepID=UPI001EDC6937|nr:hemagglutinin repeat-containing protein [Aliarcobacter butzleri]MCG3690640.1 hemagglutinin repeat-containing protein [Aliarcobacter butzleri]
MKIIKRIISIKISCLLVAQQSLIAGGLTVDKTAPTSNQANLESARNGVPIVNIVAPNQKGLSHNKFSDYNVNKEGLILNNSNKREVNTQLSGYIYGNQNLKNGTAKTILNEVTSKNKSELKGFTEVAGDRANVVVANPNGIYINGAGFINTSRATITTGNPNIKNGEIDSFDVRQGQIDVDGEGLNLSNVNKAELYAQTVKLNAKIHSQDLDVVTGQNSISKDGTITNIENSIDEKPTLSIDSSALGGIYANKISLVGTQKGVGVNLPIEISAQDDFKLSADGKIVLDKVISEKSIDIKSDSSDINSNLLYSKDIKLNAADKIVNENTIASRDSLTIQSSIIENKNLITSGVNEKLEDVSNGDINIISHSLVNDNIIYATNDLNINSNTLENKNASMQANNINITLNSDLILDKNSSIKALNNLTLSSKSLTNNSLIIANNTLSINSSDYIVNNSSLSSNNLNLIATNDIINNDNASLNSGVLSLSSKSLNNYGIIYSLYNTNIDVIDIINYASIVSSNNENIASSLNITAQNFTNYNTLFSNDNINLYIKNSLLNKTDKSVVDLGSEKATIFAKNNLSIQGNKDKTVRTEEITNDKSVIQTEQGNIDIFANKLDNLNDKAIIGKKNNGSGKFEISSTTDKLPVSISDISETDPNKVLERLRQIYKPILSIVTPMYDENYYNLFGGKYYLLITDRNFYGKSAYKYEYYYSSQIDYFINKPNEINGGRILGGNNINFDVLNLSNYVSQVYAKNDISFSNTSLINNSETLYKSDTVSGEYNRDKKSDVQFTPKITKTKIETLDSTISAGGKITGDINTLQNGVNQGENIEYTTFSPYTNNITKDNISTNKKNLDDFFDNVSLPTNKYGMFVPTNPNKNLDYLIESNPIYTDYSKYIGSSYFLDKIDFKGEKITKRLGDAAYETKLVNDQILNQTGKKFLSQDYTSENIQFVSLMDNAVNLSGILGLEFGKPLSKQQLENLTKDIVWMEEKVINGQKVLVPVVYLANDYKKIDGASINASSIDLNVQNSMTNSGTIKSDNDIKLTSDSITNNSGVILANGNATLISKDDFVNKNGGVIKANDIQIASTEGSVINETFSQKNIINQGRDNFTYTLIGNTSSIQANNNLIIQAKNDIINTGANLSATNSVLLQTQNGDINLNAITLENGRNQYSNGGFEKVQDINYQVSNINANNIIMQSGKDINLESSKLNATNQINLNAKNDINIEALNNLHYTDSKSTSKGFLSKTTKRDMVYKESVNSAELNANDILINANNDVNLQAAKLKAQDNIIVNAKDGDVNIVAKEYREGELHEKSKSSWGGLKKSLDISSTDALKLNSALLKTEASNVVLTSGKDINILASEINSGADIQLKALNDVLIASQSEYLKTQEVHKKSSFNLAGLTSLVVPVDTTIYSSEIHKNDKLSSSSVASKLNANKDILIDSGSTTIVGSNLEANNIGIKADTGEINILSSQDVQNATSLDKEIKLGLSDPIKGIVQNTKNMFSGETKVKFEVGSLTYDEVDKASQTTKNNSSKLKAKENLVLDSLTDINVQGSNLKAGENLVLNSTVGDINILNTIDTYNEDIKEKHAKASVNVTVQNEYVETAQAVKSAVESAEQLKQTKDDYSKYKGEVKKLESTLSELKQRYKAKEVGIDYEDIEDLSDFIDNLKSQEKYYVAAIAAATADLASKTAAIATQAGTAYASSGTLGFSAGISLDVNGEKSNTSNSNQTSNASNLNGKNIYINTDEKLSTNTNVVGSNVIADENLYINTNNLNVKASQDNYTSKNDSESINGSIAFTMYGGGGGTAGLGYGKSNSSSDSFLNNNSQLSGNNVNINVKNDAVFQGANVRANDTLNLNVGNNLVLESLRDEYSSNSKGFNVNAGIGFGSAGKEGHRTPSLDVGKQSSTNAGFSVNNGVTQNKQTVLSSITGDKVNVNVGNNTHLKGSLLASGNYDENGIFQDNKNLNFTTNTLTFGNLSNSTYSSNKSLGANANYNLEDKKVENGQEKPQQKGVSSVGYNSSNSLSANASKTLATLGQGNVTVKDIENSDELDRLNRDTTAVNKDLYSSTTGTKVDATLDTRLLTKDGQEQIAKEFEQLADNVDTLNRYLKDNLGDNKLTEDKKIAIQNDINSLGKEEALAKALRENGVSEEDIKRVLENENVKKLFVKYEYTEQEEIENNGGKKVSNNEQFENIKSNTLPNIKVEGTKDLQDYIVGLAKGVNELVNLVGEDNATAGIFITQVLLQGAIGTARGIVGDEIKSQFTQGAKDSLSEIIADKYFWINKPNQWTEEDKGVVKNVSDLSSGFAIDTFLSGGAFGIIKGASKLGKANDGLNNSTVDSPVFNNTQNTDRPSWRDSEKDVLNESGEGAREQVSYKDKEEVSSGTKGSVKIDTVNGNSAIEVKNYKIENASSMISTLSNQINKRATELPDNMTQKVVIDFRGQNVTDSQLKDIKDKIISRTNGILKPEDINFKISD